MVSATTFNLACHGFDTVSAAARPRPSGRASPRIRTGRPAPLPPSGGSWIHGRDTTGTLLDDLTELKAFDDEWIDFMDNGLLMEMRMKQAGIDVMHEAVGGQHRYNSTVFDAIESLMSR